MSTQVIVLNGGSSSGTSTIARSLQEILPEPWLTFGVDTLIGAMPSSMMSAAEGIEFAPDGQVRTGASFGRLDEAFSVGIATMARAGAHVIIDDVFLGQGASQARWSAALDGLDVVWVGVRCDGDVAEARETQRGDRVRGMARSQADLVHRGVRYDLEVDTTATEAAECALIIAAGLR